MSVVVQCKRCGKELRANDRYAGMPTRCPRCNTLNQLPSLPSPAPEKQAPPTGGPRQQAKPTGEEPSAETCKICGKPIRGKAERFEDVLGTVYHLGCYQKHAGDAPEDACRICHKTFDNPKERVKDVVGFFYHRKCYQEELARQKLASGDAKLKPDSGARNKAAAQSKPDGQPVGNDDWNLTGDDEDDWNLTEEASDDWMRPDPGELELREDTKLLVPAEPPAKPAAKAVAKPLATPAEPRRRPGTPEPASAPKGSEGRPAPLPPRRAPLPAYPVTPQPEAHKPESAGLATPGSTSKVKAAPGVASGTSGSQPPPASSPAGTGPTPLPKKAKPLRRARPIEDRPTAAAPLLPEGLELLPDGPATLPDGLELLPEESQGEIVEGLELLDDAPTVPTAYAVPATPVSRIPAPATPAGLTPLGSVDPLGSLPNLDGLELLDVAAASQPVQGVLLDPLTGQPAALGVRRGASDNAIPTWLWAIMGIGVGVVVIMLLATVVTVMMDSRKGQGPVASSEPTESNDLASEEDGSFSDDDWAPPDDRNEEPISDVPPNSRLANFRQFREKMRNAGSAEWMGALVGIGVGLAIYLGVSALALRLASSMCGESDVSSGKVVGICVAQLAAMVLFSPVTAALDNVTAMFIDLPVGCVISAVLVRFLLPTSTGRAIGIAVCNVIMSVVVAVALVFAVVFMLMMLVAATR